MMVQAKHGLTCNNSGKNGGFPTLGQDKSGDILIFYSGFGTQITVTMEGKGGSLLSILHGFQMTRKPIDIERKFG